MSHLKSLLRIGSLLAFTQLSDALAQTDAVRLGEVVVSADAEPREAVSVPFLPDVSGTRIAAGKKTSVIELDALPQIVNNNYRQALAGVPGLYLSEETSPLISIGYRGMDPHRAQFMQVLQDGIPIHADQLGYPEAYYTPPLDAVERIEFYRGGGGLLFGPQPGGALNYVTKRPRRDAIFGGGAKTAVGSDNLLTNFTWLEGTAERLGYYVYYNRREGEGFRDGNSWFELDAFHLRLLLDAETDSRWVFTLGSYEEEHGEPGGLTFGTGPGAADYRENRNAASRLHDLFELKRYGATLAWEREFDAFTRLDLTGWVTYYSRYSSRERGGGFGVRPGGSLAGSMLNEEQIFHTAGLESRLRHDYTWAGAENTVTAGVQLYRTYSPRIERIGASVSDRAGRVVLNAEREVFYAPVFVENRFKWGSFSLTPGLRVENIWQKVTEKVNSGKSRAGVPLGKSDEYEFVPLGGVGAAREFAEGRELYANVSQAYRPKVFTQAVPASGGVRVAGDLDPAKAVSYELGARGRAEGWATWDVSVFALDFDDQIGETALPGGGSLLSNAGRAWHRGVEGAFEMDLVGLAEARAARERDPDGKEEKAEVSGRGERNWSERFGAITLRASAMLLDAEFVSGPLKGKTPRHAPDYLVRAGLGWRKPERFEVSLLGTFVGDSFGDDGNAPQRAVPGHVVWDLTAEVWIVPGTLSVFGGVNNLFDEDYYARVRNDGIDPAYGRNVNAGLSWRF